jgi:hypothetical protein
VMSIQPDPRAMARRERHARTACDDARLRSVGQQADVRSRQVLHSTAKFSDADAWPIGAA